MCMKADNQALHLEKLMQKHQVHPKYEVCFPPVSVKKSALKKLAVGDVFLLGFAKMEMLLLSKDNGCAKAVLTSFGQSMGIRIIERIENIPETINSKKYKNIKIVLGTLRSRVLEMGHQVKTAGIDMDEVILYVEEKEFASAKLVMVDGEIAVQVKEVKSI